MILIDNYIKDLKEAHMSVITPIKGGCDINIATKHTLNTSNALRSIDKIAENNPKTSAVKTLSLSDLTQSLDRDMKMCINSLSAQITSERISPEAAVTQMYRLSQMMHLLSPSQRDAIQGIFETLQSQVNVFLSKNPEIASLISPVNAAQKIESMSPKVSSAQHYLAYRDMIIDAGRSVTSIQNNTTHVRSSGNTVVQGATKAEQAQENLNTTQKVSGAGGIALLGPIRPLLRFIQPLLNLKSTPFTKHSGIAKAPHFQMKGALYPKLKANPKEAPPIVSAFQQNPEVEDTRPLVSAFQNTTKLSDSPLTQQSTPVKKVDFDFNIMPKKGLDSLITPYVNATI